MADPQKAVQTQLANIERKTGRSLAQLQDALAASGAATHGDKRAWLMETFGLGHGDANTLVHVTGSAPVSAAPLGPFEVAPKKGYVSLRRKKQFAMLGPKSKERVELGLNLKQDVGSARIVAQKPGGMCQFAVSLSAVDDIDAEVTAALVKAFEAAG